MEIIDLKTIKTWAKDLYNLQELVIKNMENKSRLWPCTYEEIEEEIESSDIWFWLWIYDENDLVAWILVSWYCDYLLKHIKLDNIEKILTIDLVFVHLNYRWKWFQKKLIEKAEIKIKSLGYNLIIVSVAPENTYSLNNFINSWYEVKSKFFKNNFWDRCILIKKLWL